jgi:hypothetical protein
MTEAEWLTCEDPDAMLTCIQDAASVRKLRLFCVACCRHLMHLVFFPEFVGALDAAEAHADGRISDAELRDAERSADKAVADGRAYGEGHKGIEFAVMFAAGRWPPFDKSWPLEATRVVLNHTRIGSANYHPSRIHLPFPDLRSVTGATHEEWQDFIRAVEEHRDIEEANHASLRALEAGKQSALVRDIFGNLLRPVSFNPAWRTDTAVSLARTVYDSREFSAMPILADALQDAGCADEHILNHCRYANQPHVRGCWVCDLVLGKA